MYKCSAYNSHSNPYKSTERLIMKVAETCFSYHCRMFCQTSHRYFLKNPLVLMHVGCLTAFIVQMGILASNQINPRATVSNMEEKSLDNIDFPVVFKICIKPAFNISELYRVGYASIWEYFIGQSRHNGSVFGWGGHYESGSSIGSAAGKMIFPFQLRE